MHTNKLSIKKHSALIQINVKELTLIQRKLINSLVFIIQRMGNKEVYETTNGFLKKLCNITSVGNDELKEQLKKLTDIKIEFNYLDKCKKEVWEYMSLLSQVKVLPNEGVVFFSFPSFLRDRIINPEMYAPLNVILISNLRCSYSIILYELLRDYLTSPNFPKLTIKEFRDLMGIKEKEYNRFYDLKRFIIEPAVNEINLKTDIQCHYELLKENGNKYSFIQFFAKRKEKSLLLKDINEQTKTFEISEEILKTLKEEKTEPVIKLIKEYIEKGKNHEYIISNIKYALKNNTKNFPAYLKNALDNDYAKHER